MLRAFLIASFFLSTLFLSSTAYAQLLGASPVEFIVSPDAPKPGETVSIQARGVGDFLGGSTITWRVNGAVVSSGVGVRDFSFTVGGLGVKATVGVTIVSRSEGTITKTFTFNPAFINLLWEADTSVPPWYEGKALYTPGSRVRVLALPQVIESGKTVATNNLTFKWSRNGTPVAGQSGKGFVQMSFTGNQLLSEEGIAVSVYSGETLVGEGSVVIPASNARLVLYERDPLRGILWDNALTGQHGLDKEEITLVAQPFYFSNTSVKSGTLQYSWTLNNQTITGPDTAHGVLTLRQSGAGRGSASVGVELQNTDTTKLLQSAQTAVTMLFGGASANSFGSFFGL